MPKTTAQSALNVDGLDSGFWRRRFSAFFTQLDGHLWYKVPVAALPISGTKSPYASGSEHDRLSLITCTVGDSQPWEDE